MKHPIISMNDSTAGLYVAHYLATDVNRGMNAHFTSNNHN